MSTFKGYVVTAPDGKSYDVNAPEGTSEEELYTYVQQTYYPTTAVDGEVNKSEAIIGNQDSVLATKTLEEVPGAREFLDAEWRKGTQFNDAAKSYYEKFGDNVPKLAPDAAKSWAENRAFAQTPEGKKYFETNSPISPVNRATGVADPTAPDSMAEEFGVAAKKSLANMANTVTGFAGLAADVVGAEDTSEALLDTYLEKQAAIEQNYPTKAGMAKDIESFSDAGYWAANTLGELLPNITSTAGFGTLGATATKEISKRAIKDFVEDRVANGVAREVAEQEVAQLVAKKAMQSGVATAGISTGVQTTGSVYGDTYGATGERSPYLSLLAGGASAALDTVLPAFVLKKLNIGGEVAKDAIAQSLVKRMGKDAASAFLMEGGTEALQTVIEQLPAGQPINWDQVIEAGLRGGFGGSVVGGAAGAYEGVRNNSAVNTPKGPVFEGEPIVVPTTRGKRSGKLYQTQLGKAQDGVINRVDQLTANWENAPAFEVYKNFLDIKDAPNDVVGLYRDGKVYLNTENILAEAKARDVTPEDIVAGVTYHEALGHYGLAQQFGDELDGTLATILDNSKVYQRRVSEWLAKNPDAYKGNPNRDILALEEILAERSEKGRMPASVVNIFKNKIKDFGRQMGLNLEYSTREVETILGMSHAAVVNGKSRAEVRDNGYRTMYAGEKAADAPKEPGRWFAGPDGKQRFEIDDSGAYYDEKAMSANQSSYAYLPRALHHPELFKQYPSLKNTIVKIKEMKNGNMGQYSPATNTITISPNNPDKLGTILHEIQHNIQEIEDFARGGNPETAVDAMDNEHVLSTSTAYKDYLEKQVKRYESKTRALETLVNNPLGEAFLEVSDEINAALENNVDDFELNKLFSERDGIEETLKEQLFPDGYDNATQIDRSQFQQLLAELTDGSANVGDFLLAQDQRKQRLRNYGEGVDKKDIGLLRELLANDPEVAFQAYESLLGEVEARDVQERQNMSMEERQNFAPYRSQNQKTPPSSYIISGQKGISESRENRDGSDVEDYLTEIERERRAIPVQERQANEHQRELDRQNAGNDRYMRLTNPGKVVFTKDEIDAMTPEELFDSENALNILESMTKGYTPVVMNIEELEQEVIDRGLSPSKVIRKNGIGAGELVKRMFMYDIAMTKMNDRLSSLWEKMQDGTFTVDDKNAYVRGVLKRDELAARIFEDQGELGRALAALRSIQYTQRRVKGMQETLSQFKKGSPYEALNDPEVFYKFASGIQSQIEEAKSKAKEKGGEVIGNALNLPRALMSSMDLSAPLRQGLFLIHKPVWWRAFPQMFRYMGSEQAFDDLMEDITTRPTYDEMVKSKLALSNMGTKLNSREEDFMSSWAERIPGVGRLVKASERAYVGFLNKVRADVFDQLLDKLPEDATEQDKKDIAAFVNAASGRGNLPKTLQQSAPLLNALFFSPRLMASRIKMGTVLIDPRTYVTMNKTARNEYIKSILSVGSLALMITTLAILGGGEGEEDPRSSDFGKIRFGDTRYDILGGQAQYITLAARITSGSYKTADGDIKQYGNKFGQTTRLDAISKFTTNKAAPIPSFVMDYFRGENAIGEKFEMDKAILSRFVPLYLQDVAKGVDESKGLGEVAAKTIPGLFGVGTQSYPNPSLDTERDLEAPDSFKMEDALDGTHGNVTVLDGEVTLDEKAKIEWANRLNFYYKEWMKDEMSRPEWKTMTDAEKKAIIKEVRADARKEAKLDMVDLLAIPIAEDEE